MWIYIQYSKNGINNSQPILLVRQRPVEQTASNFPGPGSLRMDCGDRRQCYETLSPFPTGPVSQACLVPSPSHITGGDMGGRPRVSGILMHPCNPWLSPWGQNVMQIPRVCQSTAELLTDTPWVMMSAHTGIVPMRHWAFHHIDNQHTATHRTRAKTTARGALWQMDPGAVWCQFNSHG